jgi:hypothetical protein
VASAADSYEPAEHWFYDYRARRFYDYGAAPNSRRRTISHWISRRRDPPGRVPVNWQQLLR